MGRKKLVRHSRKSKECYVLDSPPRLIPCTVELSRLNLKGNSSIEMFDFDFGIILPTREYELRNPTLEKQRYEIVTEYEIESDSDGGSL
jgi:hypothetical protein